MTISNVLRGTGTAVRRIAAWVRYAGTEEYPIDKMTDELERYFAGERPEMPRYRHRPSSERDDERVLQNVQLVKPSSAPMPAGIQLGRSDRA